MNNKNTPGGRRRVVTSKSKEQDEQKIKDGIVPPNRSNYNEERHKSIAQLRVAERLAEGQQSEQTQTAYEKVEEQIKICSPEEQKKLLDVYNSVKTQE